MTQQKFARDVRRVRYEWGLSEKDLAIQLNRLFPLVPVERFAKAITNGEHQGFVMKGVMFNSLCLALGFNPADYTPMRPLPIEYIIKFGRGKNGMRNIDNDFIAYVDKNKDGWQIYMRRYSWQKSAARIYDGVFAKTYNLNKPKRTKEEAEEHLKLVAVLRNWFNSSGDVFRLAVWSKLQMQGFCESDARGNPIRPKKELENYLKNEVKLKNNKYDDKTFGNFLQLKADITPAKRDMKNRNLYFRICKGMKIHPAFAGFPTEEVSQ